MSTAQYGVRVLEKQGASLTLVVLSISEDTPVPPDPRDTDLFVRFLCDAEASDNPRPRGVKRREPALPTQIESDGGDLWDDDWLAEHANRYIASVELLGSRNVDAPARFASYRSRKRLFEHEDELPQATYRIGLTDAAWAGHLIEGDAWESAAYAAELWASGEEEEDEDYDDVVADESARGPARPVTRENLVEIVDRAFEASQIAFWRTSGEVDGGGYFQYVVGETADVKRAVKAAQGIGFALKEKRSGWLQRDKLNIQIETRESARVKTFLVGGKKERSKLK